MKEPKKLLQTRSHTGMEPKQRGNCFPTVIACIMQLDSADEVIQIQEYYNEVECWYCILLDWLEERGYEWGSINEHQFDDSYYLVSGKTIRGTQHVCIYKNGNLWHDPHPSQDGLLTEEYFEFLKSKTKLKMAQTKTIRIGDNNYTINYDEETAMKVLDKVVDWMEHEDHYASSCGEGIHQDDNCIIDSVDLVSDIVDSVLMPEHINNEES